MSQTRTTLRERVVYNIARTDKTTEIDSFLDAGIVELCKRHNFTELKLVDSDIDLEQLSLSFTDGSWTASTSVLNADPGTFSDYSFKPGDFIAISAGTGVTVGDYRLTAADDDSITLATSLGDDDLNDVAATSIWAGHAADLPARTRKVHDDVRFIDGTSSYGITIRPRSWFLDRWPNVAEFVTTGPPTVCYVDERNKKLYYGPLGDDASNTIRVTVDRDPTLFVADATECSVELLEQSLIEWTTASILDSIEEYEKAKVFWNRASGSLAAAIQTDKQRSSKHVAQGFDAVKERGGRSTNAEPWNDPFVKR